MHAVKRNSAPQGRQEQCGPAGAPGYRRRIGSPATNHKLAGAHQHPQHLSMVRIRVIVECLDAQIPFASYLPDCLQHDGLQKIRSFHGRHRTSDAVAPVASLELCLAPLIGGGKEINDLINFADAIVDWEPDAVKGHGFPPVSRKSQTSRLNARSKLDNVSRSGECLTTSAAAAPPRTGLRGCSRGLLAAFS